LINKDYPAILKQKNNAHRIDEQDYHNY